LAAVVPREEYLYNVLQVQEQEEQQANDGSHGNNRNSNTNNNGHGDFGSNKLSEEKNLPPFILVQLQEWACHDVVLNFIVQGTFACFIGYGSLHNAKYKVLQQSATFATFTHE